MIKKRLLSFLGAAAITAALAFAVVTLSPSNGFTSGTMQEGLCYEATGVAPDAIVASVAGNGASADLIAYWIGYDVSYLDSYMQYYTGSSLDWDYTLSDGTNITDYIKSNVYSSVKRHLVLENLANKYGVTLTEGRNPPWRTATRPISTSTAAKRPLKKRSPSSACAARPMTASPARTTCTRTYISSTTPRAARSMPLTRTLPSTPPSRATSRRTTSCLRRRT